MIEITAASAPDYLRSEWNGFWEHGLAARVLAGGVSNVVLLIELPERGERFVLKQARGKLRVKEDWQCSVERIWREVETLRICGNLLHGRPQQGDFTAIVPRVLWEDRENYLYAMTAAPAEHRTWKQLLLAGEMQASESIAACCGRLLGALHAGSWDCRETADRLNDRSFFDQLRLDPYYRHVGRVHPRLQSAMQGLVDSVWSHRRCLVHGDFSPKNLLVWPGQVMLIDFEVGHFGDPAFDLGFFLTHLVLKAIWSGPRRAEYLRLVPEFWSAYCTELAAVAGESKLADLEARSCWNLAGCMLARVDGKSPVDYLTSAQKDEVRRRATEWILKPPGTMEQVLALVGADR